MDNLLLRLLSQLDKNPLSPYYGCFHRAFWHYKMASDFPSSIYQLGALSLTLAYTNNFSSAFYHNKQIFDFIKASVNFWASIQDKDGSFNEWYPNEHSIVATAFTTWGVSESLLLLNSGERNTIAKSLREVFLKIGVFLEKNIDTIALNHTAGSMAALYNLYLITGDTSYLDALVKNKKIILSNQDEEGWFAEYGDPDIGYQSLSIFFLAQYWLKSKDEEMFLPLKRAIEFLSYFTHPDGTIGGEYASRNTKYIFRYGLHLLSSHIPRAKKILNDVYYDRIVNINSADDRYFIFFFLPDFMLMHGKDDGGEASEHNNKLGFKRFPNCGIFINETEKYKCIVNAKKGGAIKLFDKLHNKLTFSGLGYMHYGSRNRVFTTLGFGSSSYMVETCPDGIIIKVKAQFLRCDMANPLAGRFIFFRLFNIFLERFTIIHKWFDRYLKLKKVKVNPSAKGRLDREIILREGEVRLIDEIKGIDIEEGVNHGLYEFSALSFRFVPTSKFSYSNEWNKDLFEPLQIPGGEKIFRDRKFVFVT